jgi:hypothetical protein
MTDSPSPGLSTSRNRRWSTAPDRPSIENNPEPTDLPLRPEQHAPPGVDVKDLRPLRGRPCGPIPDPDASTRRAQRQAERSQKKITNKNPELTGPRSFRNDTNVKNPETEDR